MSTVTAQDCIRGHMEVVCSRGEHVGTVDYVYGEDLMLTRRDSEDNRHHAIPTRMVASVDGKVRLSEPRDEVKRVWKTD